MPWTERITYWRRWVFRRRSDANQVTIRDGNTRMTPNEAFDYVVIGGGSSGCVVAGQLASDPSLQVLLLECGDRAEANPETLRADGYKDAFINDLVMWERFSVPQAGCANKRLYMGSGRGMGGSGAVNAMVYLRGSQSDFALWNIDGWRWPDIVGEFEALERKLVVHRRDPTHATEAFLAAATQAGFSRSDDLNDGDLHGRIGYEWMNYAGCQRRNSYVAFVKPMLEHSNLRVRTRARAERIVFDAERRAVAVEYVQDGALMRAHLRREVIVSSGAIETPKLLMLSGIGPADELIRQGISVVSASDEVGKNFHDHPNVTLFYKSKTPIDCNYPQVYGFHRVNPNTPWPLEQSDTCYVFYPARSSLREALIRMLPAVALPYGLYRRPIMPKLVRSSVALGFRSPHVRRFVEHVYGIVVILGKPQSRGTIRLRSADSQDDPVVDPAYFEHPNDIQTMLRGVQLARTLAEQTPLEHIGNLELFPGRIIRSQRRLETWIRGNAMTTYHYAGTCRMGTDDRSVVDAKLRVRGVRGVRVADASIMPFVPVSALNAPSMMIGLRAAKFIRESS